MVYVHTEAAWRSSLVAKKMENGFTVGFRVTPAKLQCMRIRHDCVQNNYTSEADTCSADRTCRNLNNKIHCLVRNLHTLLCLFIISIIIIIIIIIITFMQGIYTYIPETNYVPREDSVAAILLLLFMVHISLVSVLNLLYFYISTFRIMCAVPNMAVFCSSLTSCFPGMLLMYFLNDFEIVPVAPIITGITLVFTFHTAVLLLLLYYYWLLVSASKGHHQANIYKKRKINVFDII